MEFLVTPQNELLVQQLLAGAERVAREEGVEVLEDGFLHFLGVQISFALRRNIVKKIPSIGWNAACLTGGSVLLGSPSISIIHSVILTYIE